MHKVGHLLLKVLLLVSLSFALIACNKITEENFSKIQQGMSMRQVIAILGEPANINSIDVIGRSLTSASWKSQDAEINIQFLNNQVEIKSFSKPQFNQPNVSTYNNS